MTFEIAVARVPMMPRDIVLPHAPGLVSVDAHVGDAGRPYSRTAVAKERVKPKYRVRPPSPAKEPVMPNVRLPGSPLPTEFDE